MHYSKREAQECVQILGKRCYKIYNVPLTKSGLQARLVTCNKVQGTIKNY